MIKRVICLILVAVSLILFISHRYESQEDPVAKDIQTIKKVVSVFEDELNEFGISTEKINEIIAKIEEYSKETKYIIVFDIKNDTNPILSTSIHFPVKKDFFDSVEIGDKVAEEEVKSIEDLIQINNSIGSWTVTIKDKQIREQIKTEVQNDEVESLSVL
jgi:hypothetical protein